MGGVTLFEIARRRGRHSGNVASYRLFTPSIFDGPLWPSSSIADRPLPWTRCLAPSVVNAGLRDAASVR
eukprot:1925181-Prymnesium_polylepis.1